MTSKSVNSNTVTPTLKEYVFGAHLGQGTYGVVYKACKRGSRGKELFAIKCVPKKTSKASADNLISEISILKKIKGDFIVELHDFHWDHFYIYLIFEYCDAGDLRHYLVKHKCLHEELVKHFLQHLASALHVLRANSVAHFDLKPHNLLLAHRADGSLILKVADFGFAQHLFDNDEVSTLCGSPLYMAPEIFLKRKYDARVDLWSTGVILYECLFGEAPFKADTVELVAKKIISKEKFKIPGKSKTNVSSSCRDLLSRLLEKDPEKRISFQDFFEHSFIDLEHMPSKASYDKCAKLIQQAVELDKAGSYSEACDHYIAGLQYALPIITWGTGSPDFKKELDTFRLRVQSYVKRAEELKRKCHVSNLTGEEEMAFLTAFDEAEEGDSLAECGLSSEALNKYTKALDVLVPIVSRFEGAEKENIYKAVQQWIERAEKLKLACDDRQEISSEIACSDESQNRTLTSSLNDTSRRRRKRPSLKLLPKTDKDFSYSDNCRVHLEPQFSKCQPRDMIISQFCSPVRLPHCIAQLVSTSSKKQSYSYQGLNMFAALFCACLVVVQASQPETAGPTTTSKAKVILSGDSLTALSFTRDGQWGSLLQNRLGKAAQVVNNGLSGYTSRDYLARLPKLFQKTINFDDVACVTVLLGTNDCLKLAADRAVSTSEYMTNLANIVQFFVDKGLAKDRIVLITPPPFYIEKFNRRAKGGRTATMGRNNRTIEYVEACLEVGKALQVEALNLHQAFTRDSRGEALVTDGIHFSAEGSKLLFQHLWPLVESKVLKHTGIEEL
ncbi:Serine/threonine-protein kinase ULK3 [Halotydeus destructor]|nr:Serine/threonine-protein kinase ULK3 [Halotydeus destructor]